MRDFIGGAMDGAEVASVPVDQVEPVELRPFLEGGCAISGNGAVESNGTTAATENVYAFAVQPVDAGRVAQALEAAGYSGDGSSWSKGSLAQAGAETGEAWAVWLGTAQDADAASSDIDIAAELPEATHVFVVTHMVVGED